MIKAYKSRESDNPRAVLLDDGLGMTLKGHESSFHLFPSFGIFFMCVYKLSPWTILISKIHGLNIQY